MVGSSVVEVEEGGGATAPQYTVLRWVAPHHLQLHLYTSLGYTNPKYIGCLSEKACVVCEFGGGVSLDTRER